MKSLLKGDDPNINELLGQYAGVSKEKNIIEKLNNELAIKNIIVILKEIRKSICDYYAEKYSTECVIQ